MSTMLHDVEIPDFDTDRYEAGNYTGIVENLDPDGDTKMMWDKDNADEVKLAQQVFKNGRKKGMLAYRVEGKEGTQGEVMQEFDPAAGRMIMAPPLAGG